ncbi:McrB family protein [Fibrobacter sp.]
MNEIDEELDEIIEPDDISIGSDNSELDKLYEEFNERYPIEKLRSLTIEEYTNLKEISEDYFCTWVERRAQKLGSIQGATSLKFGIYKINELPKIQCVVDDVNKYAWPKRYGKDNEDHTHYKAVFEQVKQSLVEVAEAAQKDSIDFATIDKSPLAPMFKWKVAFLYSKQRLLPVYSPDALKFLAQEKGFTLNKKAKISEIVLFLLSLKGVTNIWEYSRSLWRLWDARSKDAYNDFPVERWLSLFNEPDVFTEKSMGVLKKILESGGKATCKQLADKYGDTPEHYNGICIKLAGRIARRLGLVLEKKSSGSETRWKILFDGQKVESESDIPGNFTWILKPNLKAALEQSLNNKEDSKEPQFFVARITGKQNVFEDSLLHSYWRMQKRYDDPEDDIRSVTRNLNAVRLVHKDDVLLLVNDGHIYAYGVVKASPNEAIGIFSLKEIVSSKKHKYLDNVGVICFDDCEAYYEKNYAGCNLDWSQYIDVEEWKSRCCEHPVSVNGLSDAIIDGFPQNLIINVKPEWAKQKIKELDEQFEKNKPEEVKMIEEMTKILNLKKNIILQGAPGTGKTYNTAALALSIIKPNFSISSNHKDVMEEYKNNLIKIDGDGRICNDGQIGFVTFHQSMDYEDFVEGIKPECDDDSGDNNITYHVQPGIFKAICQKASEQKTTNFEDAYENLTKRLISEGCVGDEKYLTLETSGRQSKFGISLNKKGNLKLWTGKKENEYKSQGVLTRENILRAISGEKVFEGWEGYSQSVINYLKDKCNLNITQNSGTKNYVLIIDEINRGNVSKIFGELISLLEADKRVGGDHPLTVTLPYSKETFSVPSNLYIIGTMNTTDRSVGSIDYAVRRRFAFVTLEADESKVPEGKARNLFNAVKNFLNKSKYDMDIEDLMVGHSYFMTANEDSLKMKWRYEILPLLMEYHKDGIISKSPLKDDSSNEIADVKKDYAKFVKAWQKKESDSTNP